MLYLSRFTFPDDGEEFDFLLTIKRKCYDSFYPFKVLSARDVRELEGYNAKARERGKKELSYGYWAAEGKPAAPAW